MKPEEQGLLLLCAVCGVPWAAGFAFGWWYRARADAHGLFGAFLPKFIREWLGF